MKEQTFEQALEQLEELVKELEQGDIELNKAVEKYNAGMELSKHCHNLLQQAEEVIVKLMKDDKLTEFDK